MPTTCPRCKFVLTCIKISSLQSSSSSSLSPSSSSEFVRWFKSKSFSSYLFLQASRRHMSVHLRPFFIQGQSGKLHLREHLQESNSSTARGAGCPAIQSMLRLGTPSDPVSRLQPFPTGGGMSGQASRLSLHTAA